MTRRWLRLAVLAMVAVVVASATACGIPPEKSATALPGTSSPPDPVATGPNPEATAVRVWLVIGARLVQVERTTTQRPTVDATLSLLVAGPTADELRAGYRSALPTSAAVSALRAAAGTVVVELGEAVTAINGQEQVLAIAQVVLTATEIAGVDAVQFVVDGRATDVPREDGVLSRGPVRRIDYERLTD